MFYPYMQKNLIGSTSKQWDSMIASYVIVESNSQEEADEFVKRLTWRKFNSFRERKIPLLFGLPPQEHLNKSDRVPPPTCVIHYLNGEKTYFNYNGETISENDTKRK